MAAAGANGDATLAEDLDREAELFGLPLQCQGRRAFAVGVVPVGDAFTVWARSVPLATPRPGLDAVRPAWEAAILLGLAFALAAGAWGVRIARRG